MMKVHNNNIFLILIVVFTVAFTSCQKGSEPIPYSDGLSSSDASVNPVVTEKVLLIEVDGNTEISNTDPKFSSSSEKVVSREIVGGDDNEDDDDSRIGDDSDDEADNDAK